MWSTPDIMGSSPMSAILSIPLAVDNKSLGKRNYEWIGDTLGEVSEEVQT